MITGICLIDPKSCFGSCPTFYLDDVSRDRPRAEGFSSSIARTLEATDIDDLGDIRKAGARVDIRMANETWETHFVRRVRLLAVPMRAGESVVANADGEFRRITGVGAPVSCRSETGDCRAALAERDTTEWRGVTDPNDLAARDTITLTFAPRPGPLGLVLGARQTFVSTYVLYQTMAYLGTSAGAWLARLERDDPAAHAPLAAVNRLIGEIDIAVETPAGEWRHVGTHKEAGPIASDVQLFAMGERVGTDSVRVRLTFAKGNWRIGYAALASVGAAVHPEVLEPANMRRIAVSPFEPKDAPAHRRDTASVMATQPGDQFLYSFQLPRGAPTYALFLESRGWYYEWMRAEWMEEENPFMAALLMLDPREALRQMAPGYKTREAGYERTFWDSRFGRR